MTVHEVMIDAPDVASHVQEALQLAPHVVMIELPSVFGLFTVPTRAGAHALDVVKSRLPGKTYGTAIGDLRRFTSLAMPGVLGAQARETADWSWLESAFIRFGIGPESLDTPAIRRGTHQGLLMGQGPHRRLFVALEDARLGADDDLFGARRCDALMCSSANRSGDPDGSITEFKSARAFAAERGVKLIVRNLPFNGPRGSYPIIWFREGMASIERSGPGVERLREEIEARALARRDP